MRIDHTFKRRVRIECDFDKPNGRATHITDLETGEEITNVSSVVIYLDAREANIAKLTYYEYDLQGKIATIGDEPIIRDKTTYNPQIALTVLEDYE